MYASLIFCRHLKKIPYCNVQNCLDWVIKNNWSRISEFSWPIISSVIILWTCQIWGHEIRKWGSNDPFYWCSLAKTCLENFTPKVRRTSYNLLRLKTLLRHISQTIRRIEKHFYWLEVHLSSRSGFASVKRHLFEVAKCFSVSIFIKKLLIPLLLDILPSSSPELSKPETVYQLLLFLPLTSKNLNLPPYSAFLTSAGVYICDDTKPVDRLPRILAKAIVREHYLRIKRTQLLWSETNLP